MNIGKLNLDSPLLMAIVNATPDSFFVDSRVKEENLLTRCVRFIEEGAQILDIGGYSSRPGAAEVSVEEELQRVIPTIEKLRKKFPSITISIDTFRKEVAQKAMESGADWVNDISGGTLDSEMLDFISDKKVPYILMHMRGNPQTMQSLCEYDNIVEDIIAEVKPKIKKLQSAGVPVIFDPGFGFSKTLEQNYQLLKELAKLEVLDCPLLIGVSRKSMIWRELGISAEEALNGTSVLNFYALQQGAKILRVHDPKEAKECIQLWQKINLS